MSEHDQYDDVPRVDERLADWVDGRLSERDTERLLAEARVNPALREQMRSYKEGVQALRAALAAEAPRVDVADRVIAALAQRAAAEAAGPRRTPRSLLWAVVAAAALLGLTFLIDGWASQPRERLEARGAMPELQSSAGEVAERAPTLDVLEGAADAKRAVSLDVQSAQSSAAQAQSAQAGEPPVVSAAPVVPAESPAPAAADPGHWGDLVGARGAPPAAGGGAVVDPPAPGSPSAGSSPGGPAVRGISRPEVERKTDPGTDAGARAERERGAEAGAFVGLTQDQPAGRPEADAAGVSAAGVSAAGEQRDARPDGRTRGAPSDRAKATDPLENLRGIEEERPAMRRLGSTAPKVEVAALVLVPSPAPATKPGAPAAEKQASPMAAASALLVAATDEVGRAAASASLAAQGVRVTQWSADEAGRSVWVLDGESAAIASVFVAVAAEARAVGLAWRPETVAVSSPPRLAPQHKRIVVVLPKR